MMTEEEYQKIDKSQWRKGQEAFNHVYLTDPEIANQIRSTELDPFYHDERIPAFYQRVEEIRKVIK